MGGIPVPFHELFVEHTLVSGMLIENIQAVSALHDNICIEHISLQNEFRKIERRRRPALKRRHLLSDLRCRGMQDV